MPRKRGPEPTFICEFCKQTVKRYRRFWKGKNIGFDKREKYCSHKCQRAAQFKGGSIHHSGYRIFNRYGVNKNGKKKTLQIAEHREVMEQMLGRSLKEKETVHHKNGIRNDNRPENLELWTMKDPPGQRVEDRIKWAIEFLTEYGYQVTGDSF